MKPTKIKKVFVDGKEIKSYVQNQNNINLMPKKRVSHKQLVKAFVGMLSASVVFEPKKKNPAAVHLGKLGGKARAAKLTPQRRLEISRKANKIKSSKLK